MSREDSCFDFVAMLTTGTTSTLSAEFTLLEKIFNRQLSRVHHVVASLPEEWTPPEQSDSCDVPTMYAIGHFVVSSGNL